MYTTIFALVLSSFGHNHINRGCRSSLMFSLRAGASSTSPPLSVLSLCTAYPTKTHSDGCRPNRRFGSERRSRTTTHTSPFSFPTKHIVFSADCSRIRALQLHRHVRLTPPATSMAQSQQHDPSSKPYSSPATHQSYILPVCQRATLASRSRRILNLRLSRESIEKRWHERPDGSWSFPRVTSAMWYAALDDIIFRSSRECAARVLRGRWRSLTDLFTKAQCQVMESCSGFLRDKEPDSRGRFSTEERDRRGHVLLSFLSFAFPSNLVVETAGDAWRRSTG